VWKILKFLSGFCCWKFKQIAKKLGLEGKISWALNVFTLTNLEIFNSQNVKNKECCSHLGQWHKLHTLVRIESKWKDLWGRGRGWGWLVFLPVEGGWDYACFVFVVGLKTPWTIWWILELAIGPTNEWFFKLQAAATTTTTTTTNNNMTEEEGRLHFAECQSWLSNPPVVWSGLVWSGLVFAETAKPHQLKPHQWPYQWLAVVSNMCTNTSTTNNQQTLCYKQQIVKPCAHPQPTTNKQTNKQTSSYKQQIVNPLCVCVCVCVSLSLSLNGVC
jgi:hypothetical protein